MKQETQIQLALERGCSTAREIQRETGLSIKHVCAYLATLRRLDVVVEARPVKSGRKHVKRYLMRQGVE